MKQKIKNFFSGKLEPGRVQLKTLILPALVILLLGAVLLFSSRYVEKDPVIFGIEPAVASPGDVVIIRGDHFRDSRDGGMVSLAGSRITSNSYWEWSDKRISFVVPPGAASGMVRVNTQKGRSNGILFTNREDIPVVLSGIAPGMPYIDSIEPTQGTVGTLVTLRGLNFGFDRGQGRVYFSQKPPGETSRLDDAEEFLIVCSDLDFDYESWSDQEIKVYVPDGASSGSLKVSVDRGDSNAKYFEIKEQGGTKLFTQRRGYQISHSVDVYSPRGREDAVLDLWIPGLLVGQEQRDVERLRDPEPLWENNLGIQRYHYEKIPSLGNRQVVLTYWFERFAVETQIQPAQIPQTYNTRRELYSVYTSPDPLVPLDQSLVNTAANITRRLSGPYQKARAIYDYVLANLDYTAAPSVKSPLQALEEKRGDSYIYAVLFSSLARGAGIPARPVSGYLVYNDKVAVRHFWAEFYLEGFGWVPADPALGDGVRFGNFPQGIANPREYYFGSLDNQRITFSRGTVQLRPILPGGRTVSRDRMFFLQTFQEEYSGLDYYDSLWRDIQVIDWW